MYWLLFLDISNIFTTNKDKNDVRFYSFIVSVPPALRLSAKL